jgi:hypothetical protein
VLSGAHACRVTVCLVCLGGTSGNLTNYADDRMMMVIVEMMRCRRVATKLVCLPDDFSRTQYVAECSQ